MSGWESSSETSNSDPTRPVQRMTKSIGESVNLVPRAGSQRVRDLRRRVSRRLALQTSAEPARWRVLELEQALNESGQLLTRDPDLPTHRGDLGLGAPGAFLPSRDGIDERL